MSPVNEQDLKQKIDAFFKGPNGSCFFEKGPDSSYSVYAVKTSIDPTGRFSAVYCDKIYRAEQNGNGTFYPDLDSKLELDSFVDNQTGTRIIFGYSAFENVMQYKEGISCSEVFSEVLDAVKAQILKTPDEDLVFEALKAGAGASVSAPLSPEYRGRILNDCRRAFVENREPSLGSHPLEVISLNDLRDRNAAKFCVFYLSNKQGLTFLLTEKFLPKRAMDLIRYKAAKKLAKEEFAHLCSSPDPELLKEKEIRDAVAGKASVWITFANGSKTLRMSAPANIFRSGSDELNKYALSSKAIKELEEFLRKDQSQWIITPHVCDIVALEYKGKLIYRDDDYYGQQMNKKPFSAVLENASERAANQQSSHTPPGSFER